MGGKSSSIIGSVDCRERNPGNGKNSTNILSNNTRYSFETFKDVNNIQELSNFGFFPVPVIHNILLFLGCRDLLNVQLSSKLFFRIGNTELFWKQYFGNVFQNDTNIEKFKSTENWKKSFFLATKVKKRKRGREPSLQEVLSSGNPSKRFKKLVKIPTYKQREDKKRYTEFYKIYRSKCSETGNDVLIKIFKVGDGTSLKDMAREIDVLTFGQYFFDDDCLPRIVGAYLKKKKLWIVTEPLQGRISDLVYYEKGFNENQIASIAKRVLQCLKTIHANQIIHRDIRSDVLWIDLFGNIKIADFQFSYEKKDPSETTKDTIGTPYWMSPELIRGNPYNESTDIWSFGIFLIELAESQPPYFDLPPLKGLFLIATNPPPKLTKNSWSEQFRDFLSKCVHKDPKSRYSADQLLKHPFITENAGESTGFLIQILRDEKKNFMKD